MCSTLLYAQKMALLSKLSTENYCSDLTIANTPSHIPLFLLFTITPSLKPTSNFHFAQGRPAVSVITKGRPA